MSVSRAKFEQKGEAFVARTANKKAAKKKLEKLERQALGWGGFDDTVKPQRVGGRRRVLCAAAVHTAYPALKPWGSGESWGVLLSVLPDAAPCSSPSHTALTPRLRAHTRRSP
jgi:hypothetical protein